MPHPRRQTVRAVLLALLAVLIFTPIFAAGKFAGGEVPALTIVAMRYLGGVATIGAAILFSGTRIAALRSPTPSRHVLRAMLGAGGGVMAMHAPTVMPIADATAIGLSEGLFVLGLAALVLGERVGLQHWLAGGLAGAGALIVVLGAAGSEAAGPRYLEGALAAVAAAVLIAFETLMIKGLSRRETALGVLGYVNLFAALFFVGPGLWAAAAAGLGVWQIVIFLVLGPAAIFAQYLNILAFRSADTAIVGPVMYAWVVFAALLGWAAFGEVPTTATLLGGLAVLAGGVWLALLPGTAETTPPPALSGVPVGSPAETPLQRPAQSPATAPSNAA